MITKQVARSSHTSRIFIAVSIIAIAALATYNWSISPQTRYLKANQNYEEMAKSVTQKTVLLKKHVKIDEKKLEQLTTDLENSLSDFFTPEKLMHFFGSLETIAAQTKCTIDNIEFEDDRHRETSKDHEAPCTVIMKSARIHFAGQYNNIIRFFTRLSDRPEQISLTSLDIKLIDFTQDILTCNMEITVYLIEDKEVDTNE